MHGRIRSVEFDGPEQTGLSPNDNPQTVTTCPLFFCPLTTEELKTASRSLCRLSNKWKAKRLRPV